MNEQESRNGIVEDAYRRLHDSLIIFICNRVGDRDTAEDLCQDVFLRLLEYDMLTSETITSLVYTIARHLIVDRARRRHCCEMVMNYFWHHEIKACNNTLHEVVCRDLEGVEKRHIEQLSPMRAKVYRLSRFGGKSTDDIASVLGISPRTAESHLFCARKEMRQFMRESI